MNETQATSLSQSGEEKCLHCGLAITYLYQDKEGNKFCCNGCKSVYSLLKDNGLSEYYHYKEDNDSNLPATENNLNFLYIDNPNYLDEYSQIEKDGSLSMQFYLEGVHCIACLWLIEKLPQLDSNIISSRLNLSTSTAMIRIKKDYLFSKAAALLNKLGYRPYPIKDSNHQEELLKKEDRSLMMKIGISAAASMNVMLYQISIYAGADGIYAQAFNWINLLLTIPVVFYSATPFYLSAYRSLKSKVISIDLPIALGIFLAFSIGLVNTFLNHPENYFDSICVLVFLLLSSRFILRKAQHKSLNRLGLQNLLRNHSVVKLNPDDSESVVPESEVRANDIIRVKMNEVIPCDGILKSHHTSLNLASLTGESAPIEVYGGQLVYAGSVVVGENADIEVQKIGSETRLGQIYREIESGWNNKAPITNWADRISKYLVVTVLTIAALDFLYWASQGLWHTGMNRALALIIITCPCALGLATPLAFIKSLSIAAQKNILIKNEAVLERLTHAKTFVFDKTGTLTTGLFQVTQFKNISGDREKNLQTLLTMEWNSIHPIAKALKEYIAIELPIQMRSPLADSKVQEISAFGIKAEINGDQFELLDQKTESNTKTLALMCNQNLLASIELKDQLKKDAIKTVQSLKEMGMDVAIISGDSESQVARIGKELEIAPHMRFSRVSPEVKNDCLKKFNQPVMIGDGANDALALSHSLVGISIKGSVEASLRASDIHISDSRLIKIIDLFVISKETLSVVKRNLVFSLLYNLVGLTLALLGVVTPLWGAVLMPISSLTVLFSTLLGTRELRAFGSRS